MKPVKIVLVSLVGALGACATTPPNTTLDQARNAVSAAASNPQIAATAPVELQRAQDTLRNAEQVWRSERDEKRVEHLAYLATQRAAIAREAAGTRSAEQAFKLAREQRDQLILQARTREAEQAKALAATSQSEAERAKQQAQEQQLQAMTAEQRAERLQAQLKDLQAQETDRGLNVVLSDVLFETGQATLKAGAARRLQQLAEVLRENPDHVALVEGFTDSVGSESLNASLSQRRAEAVRDTLASLGIDPARIKVHGYGEAFPVANNNTPAGRQENRRVEIVVSSGSDEIPLRGFTGAAGGQARPHPSGDTGTR